MITAATVPGTIAVITGAEAAVIAAAEIAASVAVSMTARTPRLLPLLSLSARMYFSSLAWSGRTLSRMWDLRPN